MEEQATTPEAATSFMAPTAPGTYLIIARYDHKRWKMLNVTERQKAHKLAVTFFPYEAAGVRPLGSFAREGAPLLRTFYSAFHNKIPANYRTGAMEQRTKAEWEVRDRAVGKILASLPRTISDPATSESGMEVGDPGVGWIAVVNAGSLLAFVEQIGGEDGPLWNMYDIEIIPLNDDQNTQDIYQLMTPVHWG